MPVRLTRQIIETLGINPGTVEPLGFVSDLATYYPPVVEPDWSSNVELTTSWQTAISQSPFTGTEERHSLKVRPTREISFTSTSTSRAESTQIQTGIFQMMNARSPVPLYCDVTKLTRAVGTGADELECDTLHRRFFNGQRVLIVNRDFSPMTIQSIPSYGFYQEIKEVALDRLIIEADTLPIGLTGTELIFPCMDCHPLLSQDGTLYSDFYTSSRFTALEIDGSSSLPPSWEGEIESYFDYFEGYPIFDVVPNYATSVKQSYFRPGKSFNSGRTTHVEPFGELPGIKLEYSELNMSRNEAWDLLRFFDSRRGAAKPFWAMQPLTLWKVVSVGIGSIQAEGYSYLEVVNKHISHVGVLDSTGKIHVKKIEKPITEAGGRFTFDFSSDRFVTIPTVVKFAPVWLSRFDDDSLTQKWETDHVESSTLKIVSLHNEQQALLGTV